MSAPDFTITSSGLISQKFLAHNLLTFKRAAAFIMQLPYKRNTDKNNLASLFTENCGTCSTKHALLQQLASENNFKELKLIMGLFRMNAKNTPRVAATLRRNNLEYIPEAHCYLKYNGHILDYTNEEGIHFEADLIEEQEILANQLANYKVDYHRNYLLNWLNENRQLNFTLDSIWRIREQCIRDLSGK